MSRSTFSILPYINRQKVKADGTANILCRITVDGKSAAISTGISCTPQEWNAKKGEVRNARDNGRLASFLAEVKDKYNSLLTANGIITVEINLFKSPPVLSCMVMVIPFCIEKPEIIGGAKARTCASLIVAVCL